MTSPPPADQPDALEADLATVTDTEWLHAHQALVGLGVPTDQLAYVWDPDRDPADVDPAELTWGGDRGH